MLILEILDSYRSCNAHVYQFHAPLQQRATTRILKTQAFFA